MSVEGKHCPSMQSLALSLANVQSLVQQGEDQGAKSSLICAAGLLCGSEQQIEEGGCALCLQLKMKRDNISRVENYRA